MSMTSAYEKLEETREAERQKKVFEREKRKILCKQQMRSLRFLVKNLQEQETEAQQRRGSR
eukprot:CAMPEP_0117770456 /NCGR_PEP_ID=MMETSP0947-20121206/23805_1 /TAXON_ID=44440 /ORGANISM="Chattonella subsalsa, Strain CCMP2191" /LENGTH=60 /DNA_ID=CAMNT_0005595479 /DNA_START=17 /DNA_END=196 /DNA_ORIENTATION=-